MRSAKKVALNQVSNAWENPSGTYLPRGERSLDTKKSSNPLQWIRGFVSNQYGSTGTEISLVLLLGILRRLLQLCNIVVQSRTLGMAAPYQGGAYV